MEQQHPLWGWHKKAYYGKIKCNLKYPWFKGLLTQTHREWCYQHSNYGCAHLCFFCPSSLCAQSMHMYVRAQACVRGQQQHPPSLSFSLSLSFRHRHLQARHWLTKNCYVNHKITFNSYSLQLLGNSIPSSIKTWWAKFYIFLSFIPAYIYI